jgi:hypothetical protein
MNKDNKKIVVFDLDETLGYFTQFGSICDCVNTLFNSTKYSYNNFNELLDLYQDYYLRPKIIEILKYLRKKKENGECYKVMIYTNNQGPKQWCIHIKEYFSYRLNNYELFDQIIAAFKINGKQIEPNRTSHEKNMRDFFNCTKLPEDIEVCFIDDQYHSGMKDKNVYYINIKPYVYNLTPENIADIFLKSKFAKKFQDKDKIKYIIINFMKKYQDRSTNLDQIKLHDVITKKVFQHIKNFFGDNYNKTLKNRNYKNKTIKLKKK